MAGTEVIARDLRDYARYLHVGVASDLDLIRMDARYEGCNGDGFTFLLSPLADVMNFVGLNLVDAAFRMGMNKMRNTADGLHATAYDYGLAEIENQERLNRTNRGGNRAI
ncbi:hypothetical protein [Actinokineospora sp.]|uniref:hypothetical protein n=1 Tax=Actinokineospora sp. TaxID=1872133 RepID=UPI004037C93A